MAIEYPMALQKVSADKKYRLTVYYDECAMHPLRDLLDFPLHMDDWSRDYSARPYAHSSKYRDRDDHESSREGRMADLLTSFGDTKKVIDMLVENGRKEKPVAHECALRYDRSEKGWVVTKWCPAWKGYDGTLHEAQWSFETLLDCKREEITLADVVEYLSEEELADMLNHCLTDEVKVMSYGFGYQGSMSFYADVYDDSDGIAWILKSETVGSGKWLTEEQWNSEDCYGLTKGVREDIVALAEGEVYWYRVDKNVRWKVHRECLSEEREDEDYEVDEWEEVMSVSGFYGLDWCVQAAIEDCNLPPMIEAA